jgi:hypothetical protein
MSTQVRANQELLIFWRYISSSIDQLIGTLDGLSEQEINWSPIGNANSLFVLATHTLGNTAENVLQVLCDQPVDRQRNAEFAAQGTSAAPIQAQWQSLRAQIEAHFAQLDDAVLDEMRTHARRGQMMGREVLIVVARHCAEHMGQAFLTRDLIVAQRGETPLKAEY